MRLVAAALIFLTNLVTSSCQSFPSTDGLFPVLFFVESDPGLALPHVEILVDGASVGHTNSEGRLQNSFDGDSGKRMRIEHVCPEGYQRPREPKFVRLREFEGVGVSASEAIEITLRCRPRLRTAAFVVRAEDGYDLPIFLDGNEVARTSSFGVAHFSSSGEPGTEYVVEIRTSEQPELQPRSPKHLRTLPNADQIFVINQTFDREPQARRRPKGRRRITKIE